MILSTQFMDFIHSNNKVLFQQDNALSSNTNCSDLIRRAFWKLLMQGVATTFAKHERSGLFIWCGEVYLYARSCAYIYPGAMDSYSDNMAQHFYQSFFTTFRINAMSSYCTSRNCTILDTYPMTFGLPVYNNKVIQWANFVLEFQHILKMTTLI